MGKRRRRLFSRLHCLMPASQVLEIGQLGLAAEQVVAEDAIQVVIHEQGAIGQQKRRSRQHVVDGLQEFRKLCAQIPSVGGPFLNASPSEFPFLVANEHRPFDEGAGWNDVGVVDLESHRLEIVLDIAGENQLEPINLFGKEVESITPIHVTGHLLSEIRKVADPAFPVDQAGHRVALAFRGFDDRRSIMVRDVLEPKRNMVSGQDVPDGDAEGGPRKLNQCEHGGLYDENGEKLQRWKKS